MVGNPLGQKRWLVLMGAFLRTGSTMFERDLRLHAKSK